MTSPEDYDIASFTHPSAGLRSHIDVSIRSTVSVWSALVDSSYEQSTALNMPLSFPQSNATVGGRGAENTVTVRLP